MFKNRGITFKIIFLVLSSSSLIFILVFSLYYNFSRKIILKHLNEKIEALTSKTVNKISTFVISIEKVPENMSYFLENASYDKEKLLEIIRMVVRNNDEVYGSTVAFEPYAFDKKSLYFAPYFYKVGGQIWSTYLGSEFYQYFHWDWYKIPKALNKPTWSEPYYNKGGGNIIMATHSVPFYRTISDKKTFTGIVTADMSLEWLQELVSSIRIFQTGYGFLISKKGTFITHPAEKFIMTKTIFSLAKAQGDNALFEIGKKMIKGEQGLVQVNDSYTGKKSFLYYTPLKSQGWSLGILVPYEELMEDIQKINRSVIVFVVGGLFFLLIALVFISTAITRPLRSLVKATKEIAKGNFDVEIPTASTHDEVGILTQSFSAMKSALKDYVKELTETIAAKESMENELKIAHDIQMSIVPKMFPPFPERPEFDIYATIVPARAVGGDFYDFFFIDDDSFFFVIGDVSGKGIPASLFMAVTNTLLKKTAKRAMNPGEILTKLNRELCIENDACMFVTIFCGILNTKTGHLMYANAGHNPPLVIRDRQKSIFLKTKASLVVGVVEDIVFQSEELQLASGDMLFMYTDGVTETLNKTDELYTEERLKSVVNIVRGKKIEEIVSNVMEDANKFSQGVPQADDITMMILTFKNSNLNC